MRGKLEKLNQMVPFPENLALYSYMTEEGDDNDMFKLYAVIVHVNKSKASNFGHYICYIKNFDGSWYRIDDDKVLQVNIDEVLKQEAYVLFYRRIVARPTSLYPLESVNEEDHDLVEAEGKQHSPLQPLECHKTTVSPAICADSGSLPTEYSSEVKVVRAKRKLSSVANYEGGKEDSNTVDSGASSKGLPELLDVGVSSASEENSCLRKLLSPCSSYAEAILAEILKGRFPVSGREEETERCEGTAYEDQNVVESKASRHDLPELRDVGVSGEAERTHFLSITLSPCPFIHSSAEALVQKPEGSFPVSDIEEKTKTCEENKESTHCLSITLSPCPFIDSSAEVRKPEGSFPVSDIEEKTKTCEENKDSLLESSSDDSVASTDAQYDGSASSSSSPEISSDMEFDNSPLLPEKADVLKTDGGSSSGKKLKPLLTPGFLRKRPRPQTRLSCKIRDAEANQPKPEKRQSTNS